MEQMRRSWSLEDNLSIKTGGCTTNLNSAMIGNLRTTISFHKEVKEDWDYNSLHNLKSHYNEFFKSSIELLESGGRLFDVLWCTADTNHFG